MVVLGSRQSLDVVCRAGGLDLLRAFRQLYHGLRGRAGGSQLPLLCQGQRIPIPVTMRTPAVTTMAPASTGAADTVGAADITGAGGNRRSDRTSVWFWTFCDSPRAACGRHRR